MKKRRKKSNKNKSKAINKMAIRTYISKITPEEFPLWLSGLKTPRSVRKDAGSIPGLAQWIKDPVLPQAVV